MVLCARTYWLVKMAVVGFMFGAHELQFIPPNIPILMVLPLLIGDYKNGENGFINRPPLKYGLLLPAPNRSNMPIWEANPP